MTSARPERGVSGWAQEDKALDHEDRNPPDVSKLSDDEAGFGETAAARHRRRLWLRRAVVATLAAAAAVGFATITLRLVSPLIELRPVARVERVTGRLSVGDGADRLGPGATVVARNALGTNGTSAAALRMNNGIALRLDRDTRAVMISATRLRLERGALYVDATGAPDAEFLEVETALGVARDIGTIYQVREDAATVRVQVRRGRVAVRNEGGRHEVDAGSQLTLSPDGSVETSAVELYGPDWSWIYAAAPAFALEEATLESYLDWLGRETGWYVRFTAADRETLLGTRLHGSLEGIAPEQTPELVLPTCGLSHRLEGGTLIVEPEAPSPI